MTTHNDYEAEAAAFDAAEHLVDERARPLTPEAEDQPKAAFAVRLAPADTSRLRAAAALRNIGPTQLARALILEGLSRLEHQEPPPAELQAAARSALQQVLDEFVTVLASEMRDQHLRPSA